MPIINMATDEADARKRGTNVSFITTPTTDREGNQVETTIWLYETHHGLCLRDFERNGYHDSDFVMTVWDPEAKQPKNIVFASTRGWSYPCYGSKADATPEVWAEYQEYLHGREVARVQGTRKAAAQRLATARQSARAVAGALGVPTGRVTRLRRQGLPQLEAILHLMTASLRSPFKLRLRQQVADWLAEESPRYRTPLSAKQMMYLKYPNGDTYPTPPRKLA